MRTLKSYSIITIGTILIAIGVYFFEFPNHFSTGGVSGTAIIINRLFGKFSPSQIAAALNIFLLLVGFLMLGKGFAVKTVYSSMLLSFLLNIFEWTIPLYKPLTNQRFLELFMDMIFISIGSALIFNEEGSSGGTDIVVLIIQKFLRLNIGKSLLIVDFFIICGAFAVLGVETGLFSLFAVIARALVIDNAIESLKVSKFFLIITQKDREILEYIINGLNRSATIFNNCKGAYQNEPKKAIVSVVGKKQAVLLKHKITELDPEAFTIIGTSSDIIGKGFPTI